MLCHTLICNALSRHCVDACIKHCWRGPWLFELIRSMIHDPLAETSRLIVSVTMIDARSRGCQRNSGSLDAKKGAHSHT
jgi:hypothetical protein